MTREIKNISNEYKISFVKASCLYVNKITFSGPAITSKNWQHQPEIFLNSIGCGLCDDKASVLGYILRDNGFKTRIINLNGHVVTEVLFGNKWCMLDPDLGVYFINEDNELMSCQEISEINSVEELTSNSDTLVNPLYQFQNKQLNHYLHLFKTKHDNVDETYFHIPCNAFNNQFIIPAYSNFEIKINTHNQIVGFCLKICSKSKGEINIPFLVFDSDGDFRLKDKKNVYFHSSKSSKNTFLLSSSIIVNVKKNSTIYFAVNPKLSILESLNKLTVVSDNRIFKIFFGYKESIFKNHLFTKYFEYNELLLNHKGYLKQNSKKLNLSDIDLLKKEFIKFLEFDKTMSNESRLIYKSKFNNEINKWSVELINEDSNFNEIFKENCPFSLTWLFLTFMKNDMNFYKSLIKSLC